ncbi:MAG: sigma-54 dependent transcriptional regulator [gamma proteobacterium symbiont of Taylorina sp.]|nr:sigma-54 dependent transcriptional regulator [gamma proteobacterium symbiont of Taylorina sp.]
MNNKITPHILLVEDSESLSILYQSYLTKIGLQVKAVETGQQAIDAIAKQVPDIILLDLQLPDMSGIEVLKIVHQQQLNSSIIVITAHGSVDIAVETMHLGAADFLTKPFDANRLIVTLQNVLEKQKLSRIVEIYQENFSRKKFHRFIGASLSMQAVYRVIESAAPSKASIFITGESGTGKELCAEAIHKESDRSDESFIPLNCAAIPKDLMESEIFGHIKGAFTGAQKDREGAAGLANKGTLFLDEICELDLELQSKLLRFIQTQTYQKVGSSKIQKSDIRFVCATNRDPLEEVKSGNFREDLYYRLHVIPIELPPLRERDEDLLIIARHFLSSYSKEEEKSFLNFSDETEQALLSYDWPGNIRQLQNVIRNIVVLNKGEKVSVDMLPPPLNHIIPVKPKISQSARAIFSPVVSEAQTGDSDYQIIPLSEVERNAVNNAIAVCGGNIPLAAKKLGVSPSTVYRKKQSWGE